MQKVSENEYRVMQRYTNSNKEYILVTVNTAFTSAGQFSMYVIPGEERTYELNNGFTKVFQILYEIPAENVDAVVEINEVVEQVNALSEDINRIDNNNKDYIQNLYMLIENIFEMNHVNEKIRNTEKREKESENENIYVEDNKIYIHGLTLQDDKETIMKLLGEPNTEDSELDETYLTYDNLSFTLYEERITWIHIDMEEEQMEELVKGLSGDRYVGQSGEIIFLESQTEHLLIIAEKYDGGYSATLTRVDGNFTWNVENGYYQRVEN